MDLYEAHGNDLDQLQDIYNGLLLQQDHIDYLLRIKSTYFAIVNPHDNLFSLDSEIEHDLAQLQANYRTKLQKIGEKLELLTDEKLKSDRVQQILRTIEGNLDAHEKSLTDISQQRQSDDQSAVENSPDLLRQVEQIQMALKECAKHFHQLSNEPSSEPLKIKLDQLRALSNDECVHFNRYINEYKSLRQCLTNYNELHGCVTRSNLDQRSSTTDQLTQLNIYRLQVQEQLALNEHHSPVTSTFIARRLVQLHDDLLSLQNKIESMIENENTTRSIEMKIEQYLATLQNECDRPPFFSSILSPDTFEAYRKSSLDYLQSIRQVQTDLEQSIDQCQDTELKRRYLERSDERKERLAHAERDHQTRIGRLQQGLAEQTTLNEKLDRMVEELDRCERELANPTAMKEYQLEQILNVYTHGAMPSLILCILGSTADAGRAQNSMRRADHPMPRTRAELFHSATANANERRSISLSTCLATRSSANCSPLIAITPHRFSRKPRSTFAQSRVKRTSVINCSNS